MAESIDNKIRESDESDETKKTVKSNINAWNIRLKEGKGILLGSKNFEKGKLIDASKSDPQENENRTQISLKIYLYENLNNYSTE